MNKGLLVGLTFFAGGFFSTTAQALDSWQGTKYVYSATSATEYALKIEMNNQAGTLVARDGSSPVTVVDGANSIELTPSGSLSYESFPFKQIEETGEFMQVTMVST